MSRYSGIAIVVILLLVLLWVVRRDILSRPERMDSEAIPDTNIGAIPSKQSFVFNLWPPPGYYAALNAGPTRSYVA